jgi:hypothetical protein
MPRGYLVNTCSLLLATYRLAKTVYVLCICDNRAYGTGAAKGGCWEYEYDGIAISVKC